MDWEKKFTSIVAETEANLAKAKEKLRGSPYREESWTSEKYSNPSTKMSASVMDIPCFPRGHGKGGSNSVCSCYPFQTSEFVPSVSSSHLVQFDMQEKVDDQKQALKQLSQLVKQLQKEREYYGQQIQELKGEVMHISNRLLDSNLGNSLDWQLEKVRRDMMLEVQAVRDMLLSSRTDRLKPDNISYRDLQDVKDNTQEELSYLRKDVDSLKNRMARIENSVLHAMSDRRDFERRQGKFDKAVQDLFHRKGNSCDQPNCRNNSSLDRIQFDHLRSSVSFMKDRLDQLELRVNTPTQSKATLSSNGHFPRLFKSTKRVSLDFDDDDDDFADILTDEDEDYSTNVAEVSRHSNRSFHEGLAEDKDLDLDDLELSDSENEDISDSLNSADLADTEDV